MAQSEVDPRLVRLAKIDGFNEEGWSVLDEDPREGLLKLRGHIKRIDCPRDDGPMWGRGRVEWARSHTLLCPLGLSQFLDLLDDFQRTEKPTEQERDSLLAKVFPEETVLHRDFLGTVLRSPRGTSMILYVSLIQKCGQLPYIEAGCYSLNSIVPPGCQPLFGSLD